MKQDNELSRDLSNTSKYPEFYTSSFMHTNIIWDRKIQVGAIFKHDGGWNCGKKFDQDFGCFFKHAETCWNFKYSNLCLKFLFGSVETSKKTFVKFAQ